MNLNRWRRFESLIRELADNWYPYQFIWHLHVNVWEPDVRDPQRDAAQAGAEADAEMWDALVGRVHA